MRQDNISMLQDTLTILEHGFYEIAGKTIPLKLTRAQMEEALVFLPKDVLKAGQNKDFQHVHVIGRCGYACENMDSFSLARKRIDLLPEEDKKRGKPILVLNLANPVHPGGGVRKAPGRRRKTFAGRALCFFLLKAEMPCPITSTTARWTITWALMPS